MSASADKLKTLVRYYECELQGTPAAYWDTRTERCLIRNGLIERCDIQKVFSENPPIAFTTHLGRLTAPGRASILGRIIQRALINPAAVSLGKLGGSAKSEAKQKASRENGKRGGRPKFTPTPQKSS